MVLQSMSEELPFARSKIYKRSDEEIATFKALKKERSGKCFVYVFFFFVLLGFILLVFASIVLQVKNPEVNLLSVTVKNHVHESTAEPPSFNATLVAKMSIKNPNFGPFDFENSTLSVLYEGMNIGDRNISPGQAKARATQELNFTLEVASSRLLDSKNLSGDLEAGTLKLSSYSTLSGWVHLLHVIKKLEIAEMNCTMDLNLTSGAFQDLQCS